MNQEKNGVGHLSMRQKKLAVKDGDGRVESRDEEDSERRVQAGSQSDERDFRHSRCCSRVMSRSRAFSVGGLEKGSSVSGVPNAAVGFLVLSVFVGRIRELVPWQYERARRRRLSRASSIRSVRKVEGRVWGTGKEWKGEEAVEKD